MSLSAWSTVDCRRRPRFLLAHLVATWKRCFQSCGNSGRVSTSTQTNVTYRLVMFTEDLEGDDAPLSRIAV